MSTIDKQKVRELDNFPKENIQKAVMRRVKGLTEENLFWAKVDLFNAWLKERYDIVEVQKLRKNNSVWNWFHRMWETNDRRIVNKLMVYGNAKTDIKEYKKAQWYLFIKYELDDYLITYNNKENGKETMD